MPTPVTSGNDSRNLGHLRKIAIFLEQIYCQKPLTKVINSIWSLFRFGPLLERSSVQVKFQFRFEKSAIKKNIIYKRLLKLKKNILDIS